MFAVVSAVGAICFIFVILFIYVIKQYRYWKNLGIPGPDPTFILGNMGDLYYQKASELRIIDSWYQEFNNEPYIGYYNLWKPTLLVMDPQLIKELNEVDFDHFTDHPQICGNSNRDAIMHSLFTMKGNLWKLKRQIFSTLFAPKKLKESVEIMNNYSPALIEEIDVHSECYEEIQMEQIARRHMVRTMSHVMYSLDTSRNEQIFSKLCHLAEVFEHPPPATSRMLTFFTAAPCLFKYLGLSSYPREFWDFFSNLTKHLLESRNELKIGREDLVSLVAQLQNGGSTKSDRTDLRESVGHIFSFFVAGIHSNLTTLSYALFQLSRHPQVQEKLRHEVDSILSGNEYVSYDDVMKMKYLEDVVNESLRMYPRGGVMFGAVILRRTCTTPYKINEKFTIPKGMDVVFPVYSLHMDPRYFPAPEEFIPERFSQQKKPSPVFMPFGKGPRTCIGMKQ
ncbi:unnamed protein product [Nezara viridula]|uniref:Cytochrome P450 n=1 Tax=Nezara viridula TaxID=85310 RepID=A0A9P0MP98_NEZVI|nr:unnamed protein product [Nezara viridula]